jgi:glycosyltransferase involved in cell wall biosynthesis
MRSLTTSPRRRSELLAYSAQSDTLDITIFMPCRNEEGNVARSLHELVQTLKHYSYTYEIIIFNDASTDGSIKEIEQFIAEHPEVDVIVKENQQPLGVSYNINEAAIIGRGRYFQFVSSAFQNRSDTLRSAFDELGSADIVITYLDPDLRVWHRRALSRLYTWIVNTASGYRMRHYHGTPIFRRIDVVRWHSYRSVGFYADMITRMLDEGVSYVEVPTPCYERERGKSRALRVRNVISLVIGLSDMVLRRFSKDRIPPTRLPSRQGTWRAEHALDLSRTTDQRQRIV